MLWLELSIVTDEVARREHRGRKSERKKDKNCKQNSKKQKEAITKYLQTSKEKDDYEKQLVYI